MTFSGCRTATSGLAATVVLLVLGWGLPAGRAQSPGDEQARAQVLTRGPVHEAFAGFIAFNPEPGIVVKREPPEVIDEMPPGERPEGDNVAWIPGYWAWDDERDDFLWISGTWRALPPGREWMTGYWGESGRGYQWISGYWGDTQAKETTYLPPPPPTVEEGPNVAAPSLDYGWTPGCWVWYRGRYAWRTGYWAQGRMDWDWIPDHYVWTPRGYIFIGGYWDYPVERRGILFAPVYFQSERNSRRRYSYSPTIAINLGVFTDHLFLRPLYHHYYFGDYYADSYSRGGFYASFSFQTSRYGYDPFYSRQRWVHRQDRQWQNRFEASYQYRRDNERARPPRTWSAQASTNTGPVVSGQITLPVALSIDLLVKRADSPVRYQPVATDERRRLVQRGQEVQDIRRQRRTLEAPAANAPARETVVVSAPVSVQLPRSPIVAGPAGRQGRNLAPPKPPKAPEPDPRRRAEAPVPVRQPAQAVSLPPTIPAGARQVQVSPPRRAEAAPQVTQVQAEPPPRAPEPAARVREETPRTERVPAEQAQRESARQANDEAARQTEELSRNARASEKKAQQEADKLARESAQLAQQEAEKNARQESQKLAQQEAEKNARQESAKLAQQEAEKNARQESQKVAQQDAARKAQQEAERNARQESQRLAQQEAEKNARQESEKKARQESDKRAKGPVAQVRVAPPPPVNEPTEKANEAVGRPAEQEPAVKESDSPPAAKKDQQREGKGKPAQSKNPPGRDPTGKS